MGLLDLPPEIVDEILTLTLPHGFESFVLSCKVIHTRADAKIKRHNALRNVRRYAAARSTDRGKPLRLLYELSCDPLVAQYIDILTVGEIGPRVYTEDIDPNEFRMEEAAMQRIRKSVIEPEWLERAGVDVEDLWLTMLKEDEAEETDEDWALYTPYIIISLLGRLTGLKSLQLPRGWQDFRPHENAGEDTKRLAYLLDALVDYSNMALGSERPLAMLETLLPFMAQDGNKRAGLQCLQPFFRLNNLRELYAISCLAVNDDTCTGIPFQWRYTTTTPLKRIELVSCCFDADGLSALLAYTPCLEIFKYSHQTKWHGCEYDWNPGSFSVALSKYCGRTIKELALTIDELYGEIINGASTFLGYTQLRTLEVDVRIFCGPPVESGQTKGMNGRIPEGDKPWTQEDVPCIGSMVPSTIEEVTINTDGLEVDGVALRRLLKNVREQRAERLLRLHTVIIQQYNGTNAKEIVEAAGVKLVVFGMEPNAPKRAMMPQWKRKFEQRVGYIFTPNYV